MLAIVRKVAAVTGGLLLLLAWGVSYDFLFARIGIGWMIAYCAISAVALALLINFMWDWAHRDKFDDVDPIDPAGRR